MSMTTIGNHTFEALCDPVEVTSSHRPDESWRLVDAHGHEHRWHVGGKPADRYDPRAIYDVPSLVWVKDGVGYFEDGEEYAIGHHECRECGERVTPAYTADANRVFIPGVRHFRIDGQSVTQDEFTRRFEEITGTPLT